MSTDRPANFHECLIIVGKVKDENILTMKFNIGLEWGGGARGLKPRPSELMNRVILKDEHANVSDAIEHGEAFMYHL